MRVVVREQEGGGNFFSRGDSAEDAMCTLIHVLSSPTTTTPRLLLCDVTAYSSNAYFRVRALHLAPEISGWAGLRIVLQSALVGILPPPVPPRVPN